VNTVDNSNELHIDEIKKTMEDYRTTIHALQAFIGFITWDEKNDKRLQNSKDSLGRKMDTSPNNRIAKSTTITPDGIIQRTSNLGYVVEAKKSLPSNRNLWRKTVEQLEKYDDKLRGWWTTDELIDNSCVVLLIAISRSVDFKNYLESIIQSDHLNFSNPFSIVEFTRSSEAKEFLFIRKLWGDINETTISGIIESGKNIPIEDVLATYGEKKFYDSRPVTEYTMNILWQDIFNEKKSEVEYNKEKRAWPFKVNVKDITRELQKLFGSEANEKREVSFPKNAWVRGAMDGFVNLNLAQKISDTGDYIVQFKRITGELIDRFSKHRILPKKKKAKDQRQLTLFNKTVSEDNV